MTGPDQLAAQVARTAEYAMPSVPIRRGQVVAIGWAEDGFLVVVAVAGRELTVGPSGLSSVFRAELNAVAEAGFLPMIGKTVEIHYSAGQVPAIAYTVGV